MPYVGESKPVYGYLMDEDENFIIDEEAAPVVKQIYSLCLAGNGPTKIARMLTEQEIPTPGTLEYRRTGSTRRYHPGYECKWAANTVVHILENREYTGCLVNFKTTTQSCKCSKIIYNSEDKQAIFENHHEQIIDRDTCSSSFNRTVIGTFRTSFSDFSLLIFLNPPVLFFFLRGIQGLSPE